MQAFTKERFNMTILETGKVFGWGLTVILLIILSVPLPVAASSLNASYSGNNLLVLRVNGTAPSQTVSWKYNPQDPSNTTGLVGRWSYNQESGQIVNDVGEFGNHGIFGNDTAARYDDPLRVDSFAREFGNALYFDGINDYVKFSGGFGMAFPALTVEFWLKAPTANDWGSIVNRAPDWNTGSWKVMISLKNKIRFEAYDLNSQGYEGSIVVDDSLWHHVVVTVNSSYVSIYVDSALDIAIGINNGSIQSSGSPDLYLGTRPPEFQWFNGLIDEVRIYNRALSANEVEENYLRAGARAYMYLAPSKKVHVAFRTKYPNGRTINTLTSALLFNEEGLLLNKTEGMSYNGWFNYSIIMPSRVGKYWFMVNSSGNYAGIIVSIYVSKIEVILNIDNPRTSSGKIATLNGITEYIVDNSSVPGGRVTVNGTGYPISSGSFSFTDVKSTVGKWTYNVDLVNDGGGCDATDSNVLGYVIWDRIKIVEGGITDNSTNVGQMANVWFRAVYEYDGETFDGNDGRLYVGGSDWAVAMDWSTTDNRWEYQYTSNFPGIETFEVVQVYDVKYNITTINNQAGPQSISSTQPLIPIVGGITIICSIVAVVALLTHRHKEKTSTQENILWRKTIRHYQ